MTDPAKLAVPPKNSPTSPGPAAKHPSSHDARIKELETELAFEKKRAEQASFVPDPGELAHGERGFVKLDAEGKPAGPATKEPPEPGVPAAPVVGYYPTQVDTLVTPSGAPITPNMNPQPDPRDTGMEERIKESLASAGKPVQQQPAAAQHPARVG